MRTGAQMSTMRNGCALADDYRPQIVNQDPLSDTSLIAKTEIPRQINPSAGVNVYFTAYIRTK